MYDISGEIILVLLIGVPLLLIPGVFVLAHFVGKRAAEAGKLISRSWLIGILGLIPGLAVVTHHQYQGCLDICLETASETRGWPFSWLGYNGIGKLGAPLAVLGNIIVIALIYALASRIVSKRQLNGLPTKAGIVIVALVVALFPFWGGTIINTVMDAQQQRAVDQAEQRVDQDTDTIQLQQCTNFVLVPSLKYPGIQDIQVTVVAHVSTPEYYAVQARLQDLQQKRIDAWTYTGVNKTADAGEQHLHFIFEPIYHKYNAPALISFTESGPYTIEFYVSTIRQGWESAQDQINIDGALEDRAVKNLVLDCQTPPYTLEDLGVSTFPLPTP